LVISFPLTTSNTSFETQLQKQTNIVSIQPLPGMTVQGDPGAPHGPSGSYICFVVAGTPTAGTPQLWTAADEWFSTTVTFAAPLDNYDAALYTISNLGLALDAVCHSPAPEGQESAFAATHTLTVQDAIGVTSTTWLQQLRATTGVVSVTPPREHAAC
jgi:hypothetical protein